MRSVSHSLDNLRNIILCDDIRTEIGNKQSLMGVMGGDIVVQNFPATINMAIYMQYFAALEDTGTISFEFRLMQDDIEMIKGKMEANVAEDKVVNLIFPRALATFEKERTFKIFVKLNDEKEQEILSRRIIKGNVS